MSTISDFQRIHPTHAHRRLLLPSAKSCMPYELLGWITVFAYCLFWILPGNISDALRLLYISCSLLFILIGCLNKRLDFRVGFPVSVLCFLFLWGLFTHIYASYTLGRIIEVGRVHWYMIEHVLPFFVGAGLINSRTSNAAIIQRILFLTFSLSVAVGIMQFLRFGPAISLSKLYTYKSIDNWDSVGGGIRAVGLTFHPRILAFQSMICLAFSFSTALKKDFNYKSLLLMLIFSGAVIATQARQYLLPLLLSWFAFTFVMLAKNPRRSLFFIFVSIFCLFVGLYFGGRRLAYTLQSTSVSSDPSYNYRAQNNWVQSQRILKQFPLTGIGPDQQLFLGQSKMGHDKWTDGKLMESAYRVFASMYGYPGVAILSTFLVSLFCTGYRSLKASHNIGTLGYPVSLLLCTSCIAIIGYVTNVFDDYITIPVTMLILSGATTPIQRAPNTEPQATT